VDWPAVGSFLKATFFYQQAIGVEWGSHSTAVLWACGVTGPVNPESGMILNLVDLQDVMRQQSSLQKGPSLPVVLEKLSQIVAETLDSKFTGLQIEGRFEFRQGAFDYTLSSDNYVQISGFCGLVKLMAVVERLPGEPLSFQSEEEFISFLRPWGLRELWNSSWGSDLNVRLI